MVRTRILILGGTGDGFLMAERLSSVSGVDVLTSMAGVTPTPKTPVGRLRRGGFGGPDGLARFLQAESIAAVVDATHPFASQMSQNAALAGSRTGVPTVHIWRDGWSQQPDDCWHEVTGMNEAVAALPKNAGMTFLTVGKTQLHHFRFRNDVSFLARTVSPLAEAETRDGLPPHLTFVHDRGPFDLADERRLLKEHDVQWMVSKNSGGTAAYAKLQAARDLSIPVIMVKRPRAPDGNCVPDVNAALKWIEDATQIAVQTPEVVT